ncbi:MAG: PadR family transcriptional regulator [Nitrososphaerota archaeon]|nr:PadR family transcriptional regulator [Nitrososphaerota archaeon]
MFGHWMRHFACAPKGLLKYLVLEMLNEKPMSGSEIMDKIEEDTKGAWRPSPGSIYPLLTWLHEKGFIKPLPKDESGIKRYELTDEGKWLLKERGKIREILVEKMTLFPLMIPFPPPPFMKGHISAGVEELNTSIRRFFTAFREFMILSKEKASRDDIAEVCRILKEVVEKMEAVNKRIKGGSNG